MKHITFIDRTKVQIAAGDGGNGCSAFRREKYIPNGGPFGGDGGDGGSVYLKANKNIDSLVHLFYQPIQRAEHGEKGRSKQQYGKNAPDLFISVPCGTEVRNAKDNEWIGEVLLEDETLLVAQGGKGGLGNMHFTTATHQTPDEFTPGVSGEHIELILEVKSVADVGLVGFPNAGKSSLLRAISPAKPKVGAYPFTTLHPIIGTVISEQYSSFRIADIPGLIKGASEGIGLGHDFLRHIERTQFLLFVIDMAGTEGRHPADDFAHLLEELRLHRAELVDRPRLVLANKMDLPEAKPLLKEFKKRTKEKPLLISAETGAGIEELKALLFKELGR